jgi:hypothetical protein
MAQEPNAPNQPQPERYYSECIQLPADVDSVQAAFRRIIYERRGRGWKLISALMAPGGDSDVLLLVEWDTLGSLPE